MSDYSYKAIQNRISTVIQQRDETITSVTNALKPVDIDLLLKMRLIDVISGVYREELEMLTKMATVAEWYVIQNAAQQVVAVDATSEYFNGVAVSGETHG